MKTPKYEIRDTVRFWHYGQKYTGIIEDVKAYPETVCYKIYNYGFVIAESMICEKIN